MICLRSPVTTTAVLRTGKILDTPPLPGWCVEPAAYAVVYSSLCKYLAVLRMQLHTSRMRLHTR